jgi:trans-2-enoyl-CoA reductase
MSFPGANIGNTIETLRDLAALCRALKEKLMHQKTFSSADEEDAQAIVTKASTIIPA